METEKTIDNTLQLQLQTLSFEKPFNKLAFINAMKSDFVSTIKMIYINSLQKEVGFREVTVKEQKQLSRIMIDNEQRKDIIYDTHCSLLNQLCLEKDFDIYNVSEFDKIKLIIAIYLTNMFKGSILFKCEECGTENVYNLDFQEVLNRLDLFDITDKEFQFENDTWKFNFLVGYPSVKRVSLFYHNYAIKYKNASVREIETLNNMINMDYINMYIKKMAYVNKNNGIHKEIDLSVFNPKEVEEIISVLPQDVLYIDDGILNYITKNFILKINDTFGQHKCANCGTIYEKAIDNGGIEGFL